jgi:hypothetical protein
MALFEAKGFGGSGLHVADVEEGPRGHWRITFLLGCGDWLRLCLLVAVYLRLEKYECICWRIRYDAVG